MFAGFVNSIQYAWPLIGLQIGSPISPPGKRHHELLARIPRPAGGFVSIRYGVLLRVGELAHELFGATDDDPTYTTRTGPRSAGQLTCLVS